MAYERPVVLEYDSGELTLLPITRTGTRLHMPFRLSREAMTLKGELILGDRDPLPLLIGEDVSYEDAVTAWACALLGFADATCIALQSAEPAAQRPRAAPLRRRFPSRQTVSRQRGPGREDGHGPGTLSLSPGGSATAARSFPATGGAFTMARRPATRPATEPAKSGSSFTRTRRGSGRTPAASQTASRCASCGVRQLNSYRGRPALGGHVLRSSRLHAGRRI